MAGFLEALHSGRVLLMDGAMGTELLRAGRGKTECGESLNLTHPEEVGAVHRAYARAGAEVFLTNTFQAQRENLARNGLSGRFTEIWGAAVAHARSAAAGRGWVLADLGPFDLASAFREGRDLAVACTPCDGVLVETLTMLGGGPVFLHFWAEKCQPPLPFLVSFTFRRAPGGRIVTARGETPASCARHAVRLGVAALGVNCGREMEMADVAEVVRQFRDRVGGKVPIFARPNAGTPSLADGRWTYPRSPEMMADGLQDLLEAGVNMVGGCCGTTPEYIAAFRRVIDRWNATRAPQRSRVGGDRV